MSHTTELLLSAAALLVLSSVGSLAQNSILVKRSYLDFDNAGPSDARPLSDAAQAKYFADASLLGKVQTDNFESMAVTTSTTLTPGPDLTITFLGQFPGYTTVNDSSGLYVSKAYGYNTTAGGSHFLSVFPAQSGLGSTEDIIFTFASPVQAFGCYFTGLENSFATETIMFKGGSTQSFVLDGSQTGGGVTFFGFTAVSPLVTEILLHVANTSNGRDLFGMDDMQYVVRAAVPEPGAIALAGSAILAGTGFLRGRKRRH